MVQGLNDLLYVLDYISSVYWLWTPAFMCIVDMVVDVTFMYFYTCSIFCNWAFAFAVVFYSLVSCLGWVLH
ncbi:hypothetical protein V1525DRAFT_159257 [Lipomyces kononenkoae]|uniref:Uncharacterized protein n=1 Tax=Lipomyces kononenkoae TaxID=34357 RepID=A0ACC3T0Z7_LIPKO